MHAQEGQRIALAGDRALTIKVDSLTTPGARMSMITEDLPLGAEIRVHRHEREDELIVIRTGQGVATLGDREIPVTVGATVYVPKGVWHGLRNTRDSTSA